MRKQAKKTEVGAVSIFESRLLLLPILNIDALTGPGFTVIASLISTPAARVLNARQAIASPFGTHPRRDFHHGAAARQRYTADRRLYACEPTRYARCEESQDTTRILGLLGVEPKARVPQVDRKSGRRATG